MLGKLILGVTHRNDYLKLLGRWRWRWRHDDWFGHWGGSLCLWLLLRVWNEVRGTKVIVCGRAGGRRLAHFLVRNSVQLRWHLGSLIRELPGSWITIIDRLFHNDISGSDFSLSLDRLLLLCSWLELLDISRHLWRL